MVSPARIGGKVKREKMAMPEYQRTNQYCVFCRRVLEGQPGGGEDDGVPGQHQREGEREKMAIMEAAISSSLSHPNVVQTYTYIIKQLHHQHNPEQQQQAQKQTPPALAAAVEAGYVLPPRPPSLAGSS